MNYFQIYPCSEKPSGVFLPEPVSINNFGKNQYKKHLQKKFWPKLISKY